MQAQFIKERQGQLGGFKHGFPRQGRVWVQIEHEAVRLVEVLCRSVPGMQFEGVHLHRPKQRLRLVDDHQRLAGFGLVVAFQVGNVQLRSVFLEKQLTGQTLRGAHQRHRPALQMRQHPGRYLRVVLRHLALGNTRAGIDDALRMGEVQGAG
ncbi:hypothetical protein D3C77_573090 [compost metagenome]